MLFMEEELKRLEVVFLGRKKDPEGVAKAAKRREELGREIVEKKVERRMAIKAFRDEQGVWADG